MFYSGKSNRSRPIVIVAAPTGATYQRKHNPHIPLSPREAIADAKSCYQKGAGFLHWHPRDPVTGQQKADPNWYRDVLRGVRQDLGPVPQSCATSRKGDVPKQIEALLAGRSVTLEDRINIEMIRACGMEAAPEAMTSFSAGELPIFGEDHRADQTGYADLDSWRDKAIIQGYYIKLRAELAKHGITEEFELTTWANFNILHKLFADKRLGISPSLHLVLLFGFSAKLPIDERTYLAVMNKLQEFSNETGIEPTVTVGGVIPPPMAVVNESARLNEIEQGKKDYLQLLNWVANDDRVDGFRVGLEDVAVLYNRQYSNSKLVEHAADFFHSRGVRVENDPDYVRARYRLGRARSLAA